jgi:hypothetical protein
MDGTPRLHGDDRGDGDRGLRRLGEPGEQPAQRIHQPLLRDGELLGRYGRGSGGGEEAAGGLAGGVGEITPASTVRPLSNRLRSFPSPEWHDPYAVIIKAVTATTWQLGARRWFPRAVPWARRRCASLSY